MILNQYKKNKRMFSHIIIHVINNPTGSGFRTQEQHIGVLTGPINLNRETTSIDPEYINISKLIEEIITFLNNRTINMLKSMEIEDVQGNISIHTTEHTNKTYAYTSYDELEAAIKEIKEDMEHPSPSIEVIQNSDKCKL